MLVVAGTNGMMVPPTGTLNIPDGMDNKSIGDCSGGNPLTIEGDRRMTATVAQVGATMIGRGTVFYCCS